MKQIDSSNRWSLFFFFIERLYQVYFAYHFFEIKDNESF